LKVVIKFNLKVARYAGSADPVNYSNFYSIFSSVL